VIGVGRKSIGKIKASPPDGKYWNMTLINTQKSLKRLLFVVWIVK
jgi:hypothetical protein